MGIRVQLDNQCQGFISLRNLSDKNVTNPEERVQINCTIHARVIKIEPDKFRCDLSSRSSDLRDVENKWSLQRDRYYDSTAEQEDRRRRDEQRKRLEHVKTFTARIIQHPSFKNIGFAECSKILRADEVEIGEAIIRPSSHGNDHLTITWKVFEDALQHIDVLEEKKPNAFSVGKRLIIQGEEFEDLDEILARYVAPMAAYVKEMVAHKNFRTEMQLRSQSCSQESASQPMNNNPNQPVGD